MNKPSQREDAYQRARQLYEQTSMSINELARSSLQLLGVEIPYNTLRAKQHGEGWTKQVSFNDLAALSRLEILVQEHLDRETLEVDELKTLIDCFERLERIKFKLRTPLGGLEGEVRPMGRTAAAKE